MLVEHSFVTTYEADMAMQMVVTFLETLEFRIQHATSSEVKAVSGRDQATSRKVIKLPQAVQVKYDRGRVSIAAGIMPRQDKERAIHAELMTSLAVGLQRLLAEKLPGEQAAAQWYEVRSRAGTIWFASEKVALVILILLVVGGLFAIITALAMH
ncbi:MAG TPA: hypothetical protein PLP01_10160 [Phycisphaerae bacterium]|nr:hypothetical protein [Phycisphaerae bacterium]